MRRTELKRRNNRRQRKATARNFGEEAKEVRAMPCMVYTASVSHWARTGEKRPHGCRGPSRAAHVTARGMGAAKGGRFDLVPLCDRHHEEAGEADSFDAVEFAKTITDEQLGHWYETPDGKQWSVDAMGCLGELSPVGREAFAIRRGETKRSAFEKRYGIDLRAEADRIAVEHPEPLGIRGLAQRWVSVAPVFEDHEREALLGWVRRELERMQAEAAPERFTRSELAGEVAQALGLSRQADSEFEDYEYDEETASVLCEAAGWPS